MRFFEFIQARQAANPSFEPRELSPHPYSGPRLDGSTVRRPADFFQPTNLWELHLKFTARQWADLAARRIPPVDNWISPDGTLTLRNPHASRAGVAGSLGWDLPWSAGDVEIAGLSFTNAAIRHKGNGTFIEAISTYKKSFKLDLNEGHPGRSFARLKTINLHNLVADRSCVADTLGYEFYRAAGVPAPRTTFARVFHSLQGRWEHRLLGLYLIVENPDNRWAREALGADGAALFKPVSNHLFEDLGQDWEAYAEVYSPRDDPSPAQRRQLIEFCQLVSHADRETFDRRLGEFVDLDAAARFFACEALLANLDGILMNGQNFVVWLDPQSNRLGFSPWDLDHSWGEFSLVGSVSERERLSLFHPWVGKNRFLERLYAAPEFETRYRRELARLLETLFLPDRLHQRIDELAAILRPAVAEESEERLQSFEDALRAPEAPSADADPDEKKRSNEDPKYRIKRFIQVRAVEARDQLDGRSSGAQLKRRGPW
jgi:spore coat protein H